MEIGFCGTGRMGAAMVQRLMDQGHRLTVWNRTEAKAKPLIEKGARWAKTPAEVAAANDIVITILTDQRAVEAVYQGSQGLLSGNAKGKLFIDMSTVTPETVRKLAAAARAKGAALVECPVGGTIGPAREGRLLGLAGGEPADFARAKPILDQLCRRVDHLGPNGTGAAMKLAINLPLIVYWEALGEALSLVRDIGVAPAKLLEIMSESSGGTNALKNRAAKLVTALEGGAPDVGFDIDGMRKDLRTMAELARTLGVELPAAASALQSYDAAAQEGWGGRDGSSLVAWRAQKAKKR
ncbi:MAG TPA: NAD(P)-dependent oxidoreductase [Stellaceae bacterium]|nr:NAD(P)-dependent oxidoreductase [Stellaceae bacterium]